MAAVKGNIANNQMDIKIDLLEIRQKTTMPPEELYSREEGRLQAEHIQKEEKLNVSNAFRAGDNKNCLGQWSSITSDRFIIETIKWRLKIDFINKSVNNDIPQMAHSADEIEIISGEIAELLNKGKHQEM